MAVNVITIGHIYYRQREMLPLHERAWRSHPVGVARYLIVDDASPKLIREEFPGLDVEIYRVKDDIPWNIAGARNLVFRAASTEWVLCADADHVVTSEALRAILKLDLSDPNVAYVFARQTPEGYTGCRAVINILMNRRRFFLVGGYDEDFSGFYGREETFFQHCLARDGVELRYCEDIVLAWHPKLGATHGLSRSKDRNAEIFDVKMAALKDGRYRNGPILRFRWRRYRRLLEGRRARETSDLSDGETATVLQG